MRHLVLFVLLLMGCHTPKIEHSNPTKDSRSLLAEPDLAQRLASDRITTAEGIDSKTFDTRKFVQIMKQDEPIEVHNKDFPGRVETTYYIYQNQAKAIVCIAEYPTSESGDWYIGYLHFFDDYGNCYAFTKHTETYNSTCVESTVIESAHQYFDSKHQLIDTNYSVVDSKGNDLKEKKCNDLYDYDYTPSTDIDAYLRLYKLD